MSRKVLVAVAPEAERRVSNILAEHEVRWVRTLDEALRTLEHEEFDLLIISVHFDDSRMFDLLRQARHGDFRSHARGHLPRARRQCLRRSRPIEG